MISDANVLVVDDLESNRFILVTHLRKQGISNIFEAGNGREALDMLQQQAFDLVLLDVVMPEIDGYQVLESIKKDTTLRHIPTIMITALDDMSSAVKCIEFGAEDYLLKPFNPVLLRARVSACLEKKRLRDLEQEYLRSYDSTTGLPNRDMFMRRLETEVNHWQRFPFLFAVFNIRLVRYRMIIDSLGQGAGDEFIKVQGKRLQAELPSNVLMARMEHNEFAVMLDDLDHIGHGNHRAKELHELLEKPLTIKGHEISGSVAIGMAYSSSGYRHPEDMLRDAGLAANQLGTKGGLQIFDEGMHLEAMQRLELEPELRQALNGNQLELYYQPIVELGSGRIVGFEALIRWRHPVKGMVPPNQFIRLAEETDLILPIGSWVLAEAGRQTSLWGQEFGDQQPLMVGVNVSARQFTAEGFMDTVEEVLSNSQFRSGALKLELTETALIDNPERVEEVLHAVRALDLHTALDDFGTGYCSLSYLHRYPFDTLKIDQTFVRQIDREAKNREIVQSTIDLAHKLGMTVIAEGIETQEEAEVLSEMRCEFGQGMFFHSPLPVSEASALLAEQVSKR
jgi:diguanylate cyclase (GGDEF)-like protein